MTVVFVARPTAVETFQMGVEALAAPGVAVPAARVMQALGFSLDPELDIAVFGPTGQLFDTAAIINREWSSGSMTGTPDYREVAFALSGLFGDAAITLVDTGVYDWVWTPRSAGGIDRPRTFSMERGVVGLSAEAVNYGTITAFNQSFSRDGGNDQGGSFFARRFDWDAQMSTNQKKTITLTGTASSGTFAATLAGQTTAALAYNIIASAFQTALEALSNVEPGDVYVTGGPLAVAPFVVETRGQYAQRAVTITVDGALLVGSSPVLTATTTTPFLLPAGSDVIPVMPGEINFYVDDTNAAIGTTQYTGDFACSWGVGDRRNPVWTLNRSLNSFAGIVEQKPNPVFAFSTNDDAVGRQLVNYMRAGTSKFCRIEAFGQQIPTTAYNFQYVADFHGKIVAAPGRADQNGASQLDWSFRTMHSSAWGKAMTIRLRTDLATL